MPAKPKNTAHKMTGRTAAQTRCSCGWVSNIYFGLGARNQATYEWRNTHMTSCAAVEQKD